MRTVVLLAFLVSSVAFSSEKRCAELLDSKKLNRCLEGKLSFGEFWFPTVSNLQCSKILGHYFHCRLLLLQKTADSLQDRVEALEKRNEDELERRIIKAIEKYFNVEEKEIDRNKYPMWENLQP